MLEDILFKPVIEVFRMKYTVDYIDLFGFFEKKKREKQTGKNVRVQIPSSLLEIADNIIKCIEDHGLKDAVELKKDKLQIKVKKFEEFFNEVVDKIVVKVEEMLVSDTTECTKVIIMVGGFSENAFLQRRIRDSFPSYTVVIPQGCGLAVLKGAVLYGNDPDIIAARVVDIPMVWVPTLNLSAANILNQRRNSSMVQSIVPTSSTFTLTMESSFIATKRGTKPTFPSMKSKLRTILVYLPVMQ